MTGTFHLPWLLYGGRVGLLLRGASLMYSLEGLAGSLDAGLAVVVGHLLQAGVHSQEAGAAKGEH